MPVREVGESGWHQRRLFERLESEPPWTEHDLYEFALYFHDRTLPSEPPGLVDDPLPPVGPLRFGNVAITDPFQYAMRYVRQLACALATKPATQSEQRVATTS
jgi:hypothetical protein